jgi:hypothetical protein
VQGPAIIGERPLIWDPSHLYGTTGQKESISVICFLNLVRAVTEGGTRRRSEGLPVGTGRAVKTREKSLPVDRCSWWNEALRQADQLGVSFLQLD